MRLLPFLAATVLVTSTAHAESTPDLAPDGYHVEDRPQYGMIATGGALTATATGFVVYGFMAWSDEQGRYARADSGGEGTLGMRSSTLALTTGALMAAVGVPLFLVGLASEKKVLVRDAVAVTPIAAPTFGGFSLSASF